jgi:hypothetical protein
LYQKGRLAILNKEMENFKLALFGVNEVRWNGAGSITTTNGNLFIYSGMPGKNEPHVRGVGILVNKNIKDTLLMWKPLSELIVTAQINTKFRKMIVVQCHAPTENADLKEKEIFYNCLDRTPLDIHRSDIIVLMGDFNNQVGNENQDIDDVMRKYGLPHRNENGDLIELCGRHVLIIGGTIFPHKDCHKATWVSPVVDNKVRNEVDCICISKNWRKSLLDVHNKTGADIGSDHHLLMGIIRFFIERNKKKYTCRRKYNLMK